MPRSRVVIYRDENGEAPFLEWFRALPDHAKDKVFVRLERLAELGHELRRPEADFLRDGIHELRASTRGRHYRILYFFHRQAAVVISHGIVKEAAIPSREIELAIRRKTNFKINPARHSYEER
jgi:phage-related protein